MIAAVASFVAKSALMQSPIGGLLKAIPRQVWVALAILAAIAAAYLFHQHVAHKAIADAKAEQKATDDAATKAWAAGLKAKADAIATGAAKLAREKNDEAHRRIDADAGALLVRGAGRATCTGVAGSSPAADQRPVGHDEADAPLPRLPDQAGVELIAVPFPGAVAFAAQNDRCIADLRAYEQRDALIAAGTAKLQSQAVKP